MLIVGERARIEAEITCGTVIIQGEVIGNIRAKAAVELRQPARVRGNIDTPSIVVEKGVLLQGELRMENLEKAPPVRIGAAPNVAVQ